MGFLSFFWVAAMPIVEVLLVCTLGAFMATDYFDILHNDALKSLNKIVYTLFTPSLIFASLTKTVTLEEIISWWFMPVNIGLTFLFGGILGWVLVKVLKPEPYLEGLIISVSSAGNLGNLPLIMVYAICQEPRNPFGEPSVCKTVGLSYAAFSMAVGGVYIWTFAFAQIRSSAMKYKAYLTSEVTERLASNDFAGDEETALLKGDDHNDSSIVFATSRAFREEYDKNAIISSFNEVDVEKVSFWGKVKHTLLHMTEELLAPPTLAAIAGFFFGAIAWLKNLIVGETAPLHVIQDSIQLLGDGTLPSTTLILGGNLIQVDRSTIFKSESSCNYWDHFNQVPYTTHYWYRGCKIRRLFWLPPYGSIVSLCVDDSVRPATCYEYRYHDPTGRCWSSRMFSSLPVGIHCCSICTDHLVDCLHVDFGVKSSFKFCLVLELSPVASIPTLPNGKS